MFIARPLHGVDLAPPRGPENDASREHTVLRRRRAGAHPFEGATAAGCALPAPPPSSSSATSSAAGRRGTADGRVDVVIEACTAVGWLPTASAYTGIPPEGHAALGEVLATLQLPPVPPTRRDRIVRGILRLVGVALLAAGTAVFASWAAVVISVFTGVAADIQAALGRPDAPMLAVGVAFATMMAALLVNALTLGIVSRVCGEPSAATALRARSGAPGPVRALGRWSIRGAGNLATVDVSAVATLDRQQFALLTQNGMGWTTLPLPARAAAPLLDAIRRASKASEARRDPA